MRAALLLSCVLGAHGLVAQASRFDSAGLAHLRQSWVTGYSAGDAASMRYVWSIFNRHRPARRLDN